MKVKELIQMLQEADPTGEATVYTSEGPIYFAEAKPGYYDGAAPELLHDLAKKGKCYSIIGMKWSHKNDKVQLNVMNPLDIMINANAIDDLDKLIWDVSETRNHECILKSLEEDKQKAIEIIKSVDNYMKKQV